ncbi:Uncharacterised protein [Vibrio cholerae]|uniref:Uncharacterized protein n=1 Tax=Vibrio cholerae TaxID=666 RepID=A0A656A8E9_VIBCL|nr:Uncharacterised protein [Vibrio cholerae]CSC70205.1 Uncharacterised protein [Vibrio cholerae]CSD01109.1 Uncharacterised protein [Vibrio cholerae]CSH89888.1 Uncharacterised protein [Vibrio cholerae]
MEFVHHLFSDVLLRKGFELCSHIIFHLRGRVFRKISRHHGHVNTRQHVQQVNFGIGMLSMPDSKLHRFVGKALFIQINRNKNMFIHDAL